MVTAVSILVIADMFEPCPKRREEEEVNPMNETNKVKVEEKVASKEAHTALFILRKIRTMQEEVARLQKEIAEDREEMQGSLSVVKQLRYGSYEHLATFLKDVDRLNDGEIKTLNEIMKETK